MRELFTAHGVARWLSFFAGWLALGRIGPADLAAGIAIAALAAHLSLRLLPPAGGRVRLAGVMSYLLRFATGSLAAGLDVARRVAATPPRVAPGIRTMPCPVPEGLARDAFRALASLQPGTLPLAAPGPDLAVHCLDTGSRVAEMLAADARAFLAMREPGTGASAGHGPAGSGRPHG